MKNKQKKKMFTVVIILLLTSWIFFCFMDYKEFMGLSVVSQSELSELLEGKQYIDKVRNISEMLLFEDLTVPYEMDTNTIYVSQNSETKNYYGSFMSTTDNCYLYILDDKYIHNKKEALVESHIFSLYIVQDEFYTIVDLVFTGIPILMIDDGTTFDTKDFVDAFSLSGDMILQNPSDSDVDIYSIKSAKVLLKRNAGVQKYTLKLFHDKSHTDPRRLSLLGLKKDSEYKLIPVQEDTSLISQKLASYVWNSICRGDGKYDFSVEMEYAEVIINQHYCGLYLIKRPQERQEVKLEENDILYSVASLEPPEAENGYWGYEIQYPVMDSVEDWSLICGYYDVLRGTESGVRLEDIVEPQNIIDYNIFIETTYGVKNACKNRYLLAEYEDNGMYKFYRFPRTFSYSFGVLPDNTAKFTKDVSVNVASRILEDEEYERLVRENPNLIAATRERWMNLRSGVLSTNTMQEEADKYMEYIEKSGVLNRFSVTDDYTLMRVEMAEFIEERMNVLDVYYLE